MKTTTKLIENDAKSKINLKNCCFKGHFRHLNDYDVTLSAKAVTLSKISYSM
jgi:hypothetical protein